MAGISCAGWPCIDICMAIGHIRITQHYTGLDITDVNYRLQT